MLSVTSCLETVGQPFCSASAIIWLINASIGIGVASGVGVISGVGEGVISGDGLGVINGLGVTSGVGVTLKKGSGEGLASGVLVGFGVVGTLLPHASANKKTAAPAAAFQGDNRSLCISIPYYYKENFLSSGKIDS